eukprot:TRINITY_DN16519_c0_g1_i1.p1 TRINITY_DN16519_c0_g1~~TRINITY_DN16519_c0_g1_i1.p1  ORF type:complete len:196 (-),score=41.32 TRINITY_DN16519_c0_g1_i1:63-602(-)
MAGSCPPAAASLLLLVVSSATAFSCVAPAVRSCQRTFSSALHGHASMSSARAASSTNSGFGISSAGAVLSTSAACGLAVALAKSFRRSKVKLQAEKQYWEGEWICADCGYIYNERAYGSKFEDLQMGYKCPQCAAPRRRFARKLGDKIGTTLDGGDTPIIIFSVVCLVIVLGIAYYSLQ